MNKQQDQDPRKRKRSKSVKSKKSDKSENKTLDLYLNKGKDKKALQSKADRSLSNVQIPIYANEVNQIQKLMQKCHENPSLNLKRLVEMYKNYPHIFQERRKYQKNIDEEYCLLIKFGDLIASHYSDFPFLESQYASKVYDNLINVISKHNSKMSKYQLQLIKITIVNIWKEKFKSPIEFILENTIKYYSKIITLIVSGAIQFYQKNCAQELLEIHSRGMIKALEASKDKKSAFKSIIKSFYDDVINILAKAPSGISYTLPLYDLAGLSFTSAHSSCYIQILTMVFKKLKQILYNLKQTDSDEQIARSSQYLMKVVFLLGTFFDFKSIFCSENDHFYSKQVILMILLVYNKKIMNLLEELQKIQRNTVPKILVRSLFDFCAMGSIINKQNVIQEQVQKIILIPQWFKLLDIKQVSSKQEELTASVSLFQLSSKVLFQIFYRIEKLLAHYNLQLYMDLYIENPSTFCSQYFIINIFQGQTIETILEFMLKFTQKWVNADIKTFDFNFYLIHFFKKCVKQDTICTLGSYIHNLDVASFLKINQIMFKMSFDEDKKKLILPQSGLEVVRLANLTAAGFADNYTFISRVLPCFTEQLLWKQMIHSLIPSNNYFCVKALYSVINYEVDFRDDNMPLVWQIADNFYKSINKQNIEFVFSIFHLICCLSYRQKQINQQAQRNKKKFQGKILELLINRCNQLVSLCRVVCQRRSNAMNRVRLSSDMVNDNLKYFEKTKRMNSHFMRNIVRWMDSLQNIDQLIHNNKSYEDIIEKYNIFSQGMQSNEFHLLRSLSHYCSQHFYSNTLENKIVPKIRKGQMVSITYLMYMKEIISMNLGKYSKQGLEEYCISPQQIISYYQKVLSMKVQVTNQRQILKQKLIVLDSLHELMVKLNDGKLNNLKTFYLKKYQKSLKYYIVQYALQNPQLVSKYQRQLILHLKTCAVKIIMIFYQSDFEILNKNQVFGLLLELSLDKMIEIRMLVVNDMISRFKQKQVKKLRFEKFEIMAILTIMSIFQVNPLLKMTAQNSVKQIKKVGEDSPSLGLLVLLVCLKMIFQDILRSIKKEQYYIYLDTFLISFSELWFSNKQWQYMTYYFMEKYINQKNILFQINEVSFRSYIQRYIINRQKSDFVLECQIKDYLARQFSFQLPPQEETDIDSNYIKNVMENLPLRAFLRLKQIFTDKKRNGRIIKGKKDIRINWNTLQSHELIHRFEEPVNIQKIEFQLP